MRKLKVLLTTVALCFVLIILVLPMLSANTKNGIYGEKLIKKYPIPSYHITLEIYGYKDSLMKKTQRDGCSSRYANAILYNMPPKIGMLKIIQIIDETLKEGGYNHIITKIQAVKK